MGALPARGAHTSRQKEAVKKSLEEQKHFTQRRKVLEGAKKTKQLSFAILCALASLREIVHFFTASKRRDVCATRLTGR
jgi:mRNA-degrading endonuclease RelE of RelBE toxin-antitoxin system